MKYTINFEPYIGSRFAATLDNTAGDQWTEPFVAKIGLKSIIRIDTNNKIYAAPWLENYDWLKLRAVLYYENSTPKLAMRFGPFLPRPIAKNKPHPLSQAGQTILRSRDIIPDNDLGLSFGLKNIFFFDQINLGFFEAVDQREKTNKKKSFGEFNFGLSKQWDGFAVDLAGYAGPLRSGWALELQTTNLSLLYYRNYSDYNSLQSILLYWQTAKDDLPLGDFYLSLIHNWLTNEYESLSYGWIYKLNFDLNGTTFFVNFGFGIQSEPETALSLLFMFSL